MGAQRPERVQEAIRQEISKIVHEEIKDPRIGFITITGVELTRDLRHAKVYFSVLGEAKARHLALKGLVSAKGHIKGLLADRINLKFMPQIEFKIDESLERTQRIYSILDKIKKEKPDEHGAGGDKKT